MVDSTGGADRAQIKKDLYEFAAKHLAAFDGYEEVNKEDIEIDGKSVKTCTRRVKVDDMGYVMVCKGDVGGLNIAKFKGFRDNVVENLVKMDPDRLKATKLPDKEGCDNLILMQIKMPFPMTNRSLCNAFYF